MTEVKSPTPKPDCVRIAVMKDAEKLLALLWGKLFLGGHARTA